MDKKDKKTICVYCSSSNNLPEKFYKFGKTLGAQIGEEGYNMVYGGTTVGMMGVIADNALKNGAEVIGVIPERIASFGLKHPALAKVIITKDMRERKAAMEKYSDVFVAAPGGFGTFEEIFEILVAKQLGYHNKPVIFLNYDNYYSNMFKMFADVYSNGFAKAEMKSLYFIANNLDDMFDYIKTYTPKEIVLKW
ncbi:MAG: TIGR00730 family Rossman fold protein [Candidatus Gastranaerophilales bacterium]|nr:TIGR00730 family Rossman fold protein [Candidatus Gastranaerophilales bacterium]